VPSQSIIGIPSALKMATRTSIGSGGFSLMSQRVTGFGSSVEFISTQHLTTPCSYELVS